MTDDTERAWWYSLPAYAEPRHQFNAPAELSLDHDPDAAELITLAALAFHRRRALLNFPPMWPLVVRVYPDNHPNTPAVAMLVDMELKPEFTAYLHTIDRSRA